MYICTNGCHSSPDEGEFSADLHVYSVSVDYDGEIESHRSIGNFDYETQGVVCDGCSYEAEYCDYCTYERYCENHGGGAGSGEVVQSEFSTNVQWVSKPAS
jgi:hypothetical protein